MMKSFLFILLFILSAFLIVTCGTESTPIYTLTTSVNGEGTITPASGEYEEGEIISLTANSSNGWAFDRWEGDLSSVQNPSSVTMHRNNNITAFFVEINWSRDQTTAVVEVTNPVTGMTWMDRNLGATRAATSPTDSEAYGDLYQWGRAADGHQIINRFDGDGKTTSGTTTTLSISDQPGHGNFILAPDRPQDWRSPFKDNLWQGVNGTNNPCPDGYRLPTRAEWKAEYQSWSSYYLDGAFASPLKLPAAGYRHSSNGSIGRDGTYGYYWSSTVSGNDSRYLIFKSGGGGVSSLERAMGFSVRCIKN